MSDGWHLKGDVPESYHRFLHFQYGAHDYIMGGPMNEDPTVVRIWPGRKYETLNRKKSRQFVICGVRGFESYKDPTEDLRVVNLVTLLNGASLEFGSIASGYHKQKNTTRPWLEFFDYDKAKYVLSTKHTLQKAPVGDYQTKPQATKGTIEMNTTEMLRILQLETGAKIVSAHYIDDEHAVYSFINALDLDLKQGDMVVCESRDSFALLTVKDPDVMVTDIGCPIGDLKHVVAKVKNADYMAVKTREAEAHRRLALSEVTAKLDAYRKQVGDGAFDAVAGMLGHDDVVDGATP